MLRAAATAPRLITVTAEEQQPSGFALRVALAKLEDRRETARRTGVVLQVVAITLFWLVSLALLIGWGLTGTAGGERDVAALLAVVVPFVAAVIATRHGRVWVGGAYVVLTLAMVVPALGIAGLG
jgi:hypothetical protein